MRRVWMNSLSLSALLLLLATVAWAAKWNAANYPLRVHVFQFNAHSHYWRPGGGYSSLDSVDGEGRANLYENGQPSAFDFSYECSNRIMVSPGFETYLARWKKPGRELAILLPTLGGKPGEMNECDLAVTLKEDSAYFKHNGLLDEEPAEKFKDWMVRHQYDPEHGLNLPVNPPAQPAENGAPAQPPAAPSGSQ
jgi:hypothetical protein